MYKYLVKTPLGPTFMYNNSQSCTLSFQPDNDSSSLCGILISCLKQELTFKSGLVCFSKQTLRIDLSSVYDSYYH